MPTLRRSLVEFGLRVAELREARGLTQPELAERADLSARYIQKVEAGDANITFDAVHAIATALRTDLRDLFAPAQPRPRRRRGRPRKRL